jgi:putative membrane protein
MNRTRLPALAAAAALALAAPLAFAQAASAPTANSPAALAAFDKNFIDDATAAGNYEVAAGKIAADKGSQQAVKDFGNMLVTEHQQAGNELQSLAGKKGVTPPTALPADKQKEIDKLNKLSGKDFDREFAKKTGVQDHEATIKKFETASKRVKDSDLKAWIDKTLPNLRKHLEHAKALEKAKG